MAATNSNYPTKISLKLKCVSVGPEICCTAEVDTYSPWVRTNEYYLETGIVGLSFIIV